MVYGMILPIFKWFLAVSLLVSTLNQAVLVNKAKQWRGHGGFRAIAKLQIYPLSTCVFKTTGRFTFFPFTLSFHMSISMHFATSTVSNNIYSA